MEPFVRMGGQVSQDVALWRDLSGGADEEKLDQDAAASLRWLRGVMEEITDARNVFSWKRCI